MTHGLKRARPWRLALVLTVLTLAYAFALYQPVRAWYSSWDKLAHFMVFAIVYIALVWSLRWRPWILALLAAVMGGAVEVHQMLMPGFSPSVWDWLADLAGIGCGMFAMKLSRTGRPRKRYASTVSKPSI